MLNQSKFLAAGLLLAAFAAGAGVGGAVTNAFEARRDGGQEGDRPPRDRGSRVSYADRLQEVLNLSTEQRAAVDTILVRNQQEMHQLWADVGPRYETLRQAVREQIMAVLSDEQQTKYRELIELSDRRRGRESRRTNGRTDEKD